MEDFLCHGVDGPCYHIGKKRRQRTEYVNDERNYVFLCDHCAEANNKYWEERWAEYYGMTLGSL